MRIGLARADKAYVRARATHVRARVSTKNPSEEEVLE